MFAQANFLEALRYAIPITFLVMLALVLAILSFGGKRRDNEAVRAAVMDVLAYGELHGYELAKAIQARYPGLLEDNEGSLYPILHRLVEEGQLQDRKAEVPAPEGSRLRVYYRLKGDTSGERHV